MAFMILMAFVAILLCSEASLGPLSIQLRRPLLQLDQERVELSDQLPQRRHAQAPSETLEGPKALVDARPQPPFHAD